MDVWTSIVVLQAPRLTRRYQAGIAAATAIEKRRRRFASRRPGLSGMNVWLQATRRGARATRMEEMRADGTSATARAARAAGRFAGARQIARDGADRSTAAATAKVAPARLPLLGYPGPWLDGRIRRMLPLTAL